MITISDPVRFTEPTPTTGQAPSHAPPDTHYAPGLRLARRLGWFGVGLGLAELLAPDIMADLTGVDRPELIQVYGLREIACAIGIFYSGRPTEWLWGRVAGDALDLATLGLAMAEDDRSKRKRAYIAAAAVAGVTLFDLICAGQLTAAAVYEG